MCHKAVSVWVWVWVCVCVCVSDLGVYNKVCGRGIPSLHEAECVCVDLRKDESETNIHNKLYFRHFQVFHVEKKPRQSRDCVKFSISKILLD